MVSWFRCYWDDEEWDSEAAVVWRAKQVSSASRLTWVYIQNLSHRDCSSSQATQGDGFNNCTFMIGAEQHHHHPPSQRHHHNPQSNPFLYPTDGAIPQPSKPSRPNCPIDNNKRVWNSPGSPNCSTKVYSGVQPAVCKVLWRSWRPITSTGGAVHEPLLSGFALGC